VLCKDHGHHLAKLLAPQLEQDHSIKQQLFYRTRYLTAHGFRIKSNINYNLGASAIIVNGQKQNWQISIKSAKNKGK
jgi:hypothetical protein